MFDFIVHDLEPVNCNWCNSDFLLKEKYLILKNSEKKMKIVKAQSNFQWYALVINALRNIYTDLRLHKLVFHLVSFQNCNIVLLHMTITLFM